MKYLITGSAGYIGSHIINRLKQNNDEIIGLYHIHKPKIEHKSVQFVKGDISNPTFIDQLPTDIDIIIHCAAFMKDYGSKSLFYNINVKGTEILVSWAQKHDVSQIIHFGHIQYESSNWFNYYSDTKKVIEDILVDYFKKDALPVTIIRPGNVFGPGSPVWLVRIISLIQNNKLYLIDQGKGIFHHTYIENLVDALELTIGNKKTIGTSFNITDGDESITFQKYFRDVASMLGKSADFKDISKKKAIRIGTIMVLLHKLTRIKPMITPLATEILTNQNKVTITKAKKILQYVPKISYLQAMEKIERWIHDTYNFG